jgi:hypothetical protein
MNVTGMKNMSTGSVALSMAVLGWLCLHSSIILLFYKKAPDVYMVRVAPAWNRDCAFSGG